MTIPQEHFDDLLSRTALAALFYYPEVDDDGPNLQNDIAYCLEPVAGIADENAERLRVVVGRVITNPTAHRSELLALGAGSAACRVAAIMNDPLKKVPRRGRRWRSIRLLMMQRSGGASMWRRTVTGSAS
ncbi:hypothetical protein [Cryobacterium sp. PH31-L1]|uniref:hypothetical protein n=1 Tax=Cryobacterium sp. PH31-L1 TaxID=3046199 RepID=UPI0024B9D9F9|nr:hypothetical protein [Cryobacterium sp. PH31-L1]MDJ0379031.1 hypothetical protein [Cryobacterium sp. PH31-L1]